jgi:hypothetical protein
MSFAMFFAFLAVFAVQLRCLREPFVPWCLRGCDGDGICVHLRNLRFLGAMGLLAMFFAMVFAFLAIFAVKLRCLRERFVSWSLRGCDDAMSS